MTVLLPTGIGLLAGAGYALVVAAVVGGFAWFGAEYVLGDEPGGRR